MHDPAESQPTQQQNGPSSKLDDAKRVETASEAKAGMGSTAADENGGDNVGTGDTTGDSVEMQRETNTTEPMRLDNSTMEKDAVTDEETQKESGGGVGESGEVEKAAKVEGDTDKEMNDTAVSGVAAPQAGPEENGPEAMDVDETADEKKQSETGHAELPSTTSGVDVGDEAEAKKAETKTTDAAPSEKPESHGVKKEDEAKAKEGVPSNDSGTAASAPAAAPVASAPPPPVLRGTLSFNNELRRHVIRGMWNYENSTTFPPQRFELIRNLNSDEDPKELPKDGEFHGSFSLAYFHTTSKGKQKERSKVIPESGVNIKFTKVDGKENEYKVDGQGTNQFGIFYINGDATKSPHAGDASYDIVLRKRYAPTQAPVQPAGTVVTDDGAASSKKSKKRKHGQLGELGSGEDGLGDHDQGGPLPPPSKSYPSHVVCLRGKLSREESDDLGMTEIIHKIDGMWSSGLDLIIKDPQNVSGLCNRFEYEHKSTHPNNQFPVSGRYTGWFDLTNPDNTRTRIAEKDVTLKFRKNNEGYFNVEGRGSNAFGKYSITGTLTLDNVITIFRHFQTKKAKKNKVTSGAHASVTSAPPPLNDPSKTVSKAQAPPEPKLKLDDVVIPGDGENADTLKPIPPPVHGTYSAVSRGVLRLNDDGAHTCSGKWAMTREHYNNSQTSDFAFRLEAHYAAEAAAALKKANGDETGGGKDQSSTTDSTAVSLSAVPPGSMTFPVDSAMYKGSFQMRRGPNKYTKVIDQQIVLKFRKNSGGSYNVYGKGINSIGEFNLMGTLILSGNRSGHVELYRVYPVPPAPAPAPASAQPSSSASLGKAAPVGKSSHFPKLPTKEKSAGDPSSGAPVAFPGRPRPSLQRRESSSRMVKPPSRLEDDDPEAQLARTMEKCSQILKFMHEKDIAAGAFFREPVDPMAHGIPTYHQIISEPMDLGTIQRKMDAGEITLPEEFGRLVRLVFENAIAFNENPAHAVHQAARSLLILFNQKFRDVERAVENIRRTHKPSEAERLHELKRREKEEARKAKRKGREERRGKNAKKARLDEAQAMAAANVSAMDAIVAAAPSNSAPGGSVTRSEFNLLLQMVQKLQGQVVQTYTLLADLSPSRDADDATSMSASAMSESESVFVPPSEIDSRPAVDKKKSYTKKKSDGAAKGPEKIAHNFALEESKPLSLKEQEVLTETINLLPPERLPGVIQIIRESTHLDGDEEEIDLEIDQLDTATQRKLQRYVLQYVKPPRRAKPKGKKTKGGKGDTRKVQSSPKMTQPANSGPSKKPQNSALSKPATNSFFAFGSKGDSDSDSDGDSETGGTTKQGNGAFSSSASKDQFNLGATLHDEEDEDDDIGNGGITANWDISKTASASETKHDDDDLWGAAREEAAAAKAREEARRAREEKLLAEAEIAKNKSLADAAARGDEIRAQRMEIEEKEARLREQQEKEAEEARKAARDAARAQVQSVEQTVDLDAQRDIMKQYEQSFLDKENGGSASPSSDFGF